MSNLLKRILVALVAIPILLFIVFYSKILFGILIFIINIVSLSEFSNLFENTKEKFTQGIIYIFSIFLLINLSNLNFEFSFYALLIYVLVSMLFFLGKNYRIKDILALNTSIVYITLPLSSYLILSNDSLYLDKIEIEASWVIFSIFASVWICDSFAFFGGKSFGKRKLAPSISPNKTWEGFFSGLIGTTVISLVASKYFFDSFTFGLIISVGGGIFGQLGDLVESKIKREVNVKDSSNLIPGHGGLLDRIDSLLFAGPIVLILIKIVY